MSNEESKFINQYNIIFNHLLFIKLQNKYYLKDFIMNEDLLPPFLQPPEGEYKTHIQLNRDVNGEQKMMAKVMIYVKIEHKGLF